MNGSDSGKKHRRMRLYTIISRIFEINIFQPQIFNSHLFAVATKGHIHFWGRLQIIGAAVHITLEKLSSFSYRKI